VRSFEENREFDLLVKVLKIFEKDEFNLELRIKDTSNELWFITKFKILKMLSVNYSLNCTTFDPKGKIL
jgi:hypothetical protein